LDREVLVRDPLGAAFTGRQRCEHQERRHDDDEAGKATQTEDA
jgi:hypothetical protein